MGAISAGQSHTCSLATTGTAYCWGNGGSGALGAGSGSTNGSSSPVAVAGTHAFTAISAGNLHSCALAAAGSAYCWGLNAYGGLGDGSTTNSTVPVPLSGGLALSSVSAGGDYHSCGVTTAGAAFCWGNNASGQLGTGASSGPQTVPVAVAGGLVFKAISTRANTTCGLTATGAAYCWGYNGYGQLGDGSRDNSSAPVAVTGGLSFLTISVGYYHVCGQTSGGIYCWGRDESGELGDGSTTDRSGPVLVSGSTAFTTVSAGADDGNGYSCGLTSGGAAYCWGYNATGLLGNGSTTNSSVPMPVAGGIQFSSISAGGDHACGVATGGVLYCWGSDAYGQLGNGNGSFTNSSVPVVVLPP
jgi:alpha-tubulin suppressor-like RCC1 family protein